MPDAAWRRIALGETMPGLIVVAQDVGVGRVIDDLVLLVEASHADEWNGRVLFLPFAPDAPRT
jgi:hypothetical protein